MVLPEPLAFRTKLHQNLFSWTTILLLALKTCFGGSQKLFGGSYAFFLAAGPSFNGAEPCRCSPGTGACPAGMAHLRQSSRWGGGPPEGYLRAVPRAGGDCLVRWPTPRDGVQAVCLCGRSNNGSLRLFEFAVCQAWGGLGGLRM